MKRFFLVHASEMPDLDAILGTCHYIDIGSHGPAGADHHMVVLIDNHVEAPAGWVQLPRITDAKTPIKDRVNHELLADLGLTGDETTAEVVDVLEKIHPLIRH